MILPIIDKLSIPYHTRILCNISQIGMAPFRQKPLFGYYCKNVFVSFDYDNDRHYKNLLTAWDANPNFEFLFEDKIPGENNSNDISRIKAGLTQKINESTYTLFIIGKYANQKHPKTNEISFINWINLGLEDRVVDR